MHARSIGKSIIHTLFNLIMSLVVNSLQLGPHDEHWTWWSRQLYFWGRGCFVYHHPSSVNHLFDLWMNIAFTSNPRAPIISARWLSFIADASQCISAMFSQPLKITYFVSCDLLLDLWFRSFQMHQEATARDLQCNPMPNWGASCEIVKFIGHEFEVRVLWHLN